MAKLNLGTILVQLTADAGPLTKGLTDAGKAIDGFSTRMGTIANELDRSLTRAFRLAAAAVAGVGTAAAVTGAEFEAQMTRVAVISGATREEFAALTEEARKIGRETLFTATDAAKGMEALAQAGLNPQQVMAAVSETLALAGANAMDLNDATELVAATMNQFALGAEQAGRIADVFTKANQESLLTVQDISVAMRYAGAAGAALGLSLEETTAAVAQFRDNGLEAHQAGTNFRALMESLVAPTKRARDQIAAMGIDLRDLDPTVHGLDEILQTLADHNLTVAQSFEIFGRIAGANVARLVGDFADGTETYRDLVGQLEAANGTAARSFAMMSDTTKGKFQVLLSAIEDVLLTLFDLMKGPLGRAIEGITVRIDGLGRVLARADVGGSLDAIADGVVAMVEATILAIPYLKLVGELMVAAWVGVKGVQFAVAIRAMAQAIGITTVAALRSAVAGLVEFGAALTASTGGLALIAAAIVAATAALVGLARQSNEAAAAQRKLREEMDAGKRVAEERAAAEAGLGPVMEETKRQAREVLTTYDGLSSRQRSYYSGLLQLNEAEAYREIQEGRLVVRNGILISTTEAGTKALEERRRELVAQAETMRNVVDAIDASGGMAMTYDERQQIADALGRETGATLDLGEARAYAALKAQEFTNAAEAVANQIATMADNQERAGKATDQLGSGVEDLGTSTSDAASKLQTLINGLEDAAAGSDALKKAQTDLAQAYREIDAAAAGGADPAEVARARALAFQVYADAVFAASAATDAVAASTVDADTALRMFADNVFFASADAEALAKSNEEAAAAQDRLAAPAPAAAATQDRTADAAQGLGQAALSGGLSVSALASALGTLVGGPSGVLVGAALGKIASYFDVFTDSVNAAFNAVTDLSDVLDFVGFFDASQASIQDATEALDAWLTQVQETQQSTAETLAELRADGRRALAEIQRNYNLSQSDVELTPEEQLQRDLRQQKRENRRALKEAQAEAEAAQAELDAEKPGPGQTPAEAAAAAVEQKIDFVSGFVDALPAMLKAVQAKLPKLLIAMGSAFGPMVTTFARSVGPFLTAVIEGFAALIEQSPQILQALMQAATTFIEVLITMTPRVMIALAYAAPLLIGAIIEELPELWVALAAALPAIAIEAVIIAIPGMAVAMWEGLKDTIERLANHWVEIVSFGLIKQTKNGDIKGGGLGGVLSDAWDWLTGPFRRNARGGYVPHTMATVLEPGEYVLDRAMTRAMSRSTQYAPAGPMPNAGDSGGLIELLIALDGQVVDAALARSMGAGRMPRLDRALRSPGTRFGAGYARGSGSPWGA